jgi:hypothetical protein
MCPRCLNTGRIWRTERLPSGWATIVEDCPECRAPDMQTDGAVAGNPQKCWRPAHPVAAGLTSG